MYQRPPTVTFAAEDVEVVAKDLDENLPIDEPTMDNIVDTLNAGLADGSLLVADSSDEDYAEELDAVPAEESEEDSDDNSFPGEF